MSDFNTIVSVIVPIYKVEKYIRKCIDSILTQTYRRVEIILVDDGSPDDCPRICDEYAEKDGRIKVIHQKNKGLSEARNAGLREAVGEYVFFIDSDDFLVDDSVLSRLVEVARTECDVDFINFNCKYYYQKTDKEKLWPLYPEAVLQAKNQTDQICALISHGLFPMSAWMKFIRREFLIENNIWFIKGIVSEDIPWFLQLLLKSRKVKFLNEYFYVYRKQVQGAISSSFSEKTYVDLYTILKEESNKIQENVSDLRLRNALLSFMAYEYCILLGTVNHFHREERKRHIELLKEYYWLLQYDLNPKVRKVKMLLRLVGARLTRWALFFYIEKVVNRN